MSQDTDARIARGLSVLTKTTRHLCELANQLDDARTRDDWDAAVRLSEFAVLEAQYAGWLARKLAAIETTGGAGSRAAGTGWSSAPAGHEITEAAEVLSQQPAPPIA